MTLGVIQAKREGENRVTLIPKDVEALLKLGLTVYIESGAGEKAGYSDDMFQEKQAKILQNTKQVFQESDIIVHISPFLKQEIDFMKKGQVVVSFLDPLINKTLIQDLSKQKVTSFSMEMIPRITRAQNMDALSSMANIAGYKSVLLASYHFSKMVPMMTTAAGTMTAARFLIVGVGVAGLQAIATAKRLGAVVYAYDIRPTVKEQVQSLGAKFVDIHINTQEAEEKSGYAKAMDDSFYQKQRQLLKQTLQNSDIVITTAAIPGKKSPILITQDMVESMKTGSIIVDLASERGGNCELTQHDKTIQKYGVLIMGPKDLASSIPYHASQMYSKNIFNLLKIMIQNQQFHFEDPILQEIMVTQDGKIVHKKVQEALGFQK